MKIFSTHRKKLEPKRRFGGRDFRNKIRAAADYKRVFNPNPSGWFFKLLGKIGLASKFWRTIALVGFIIIIYYLCISSIFVVTNVEVKGNVQVTAQQIQDVIAESGRSRLFFIKENNYFLMTQGRTNKLLTQKLPTIKRISKYERIWPNSVKIEITERAPGFVIKSNEKYFLIDDEGTVVSQVDSPNNMLVVEDQLIEDFGTGELLPNSKLASFILSMVKQWGGKVSVPIAGVKFPGKESTEVQFVSAEGWSVMFDTSRSVITQLANLAVLLNKQIAPKDRAKLSYIDLRLSNWAYYCFKFTPCSQQPLQDAGGTTTPDVKK